MNMNMKKIIAILIMTVALSACYEDYVLDYDYDGIYFPYQLDVRTFVVGEGMKINFGVSLGGVRDNDRDRIVEYAMDNSLISASTLAAMKASSATYIKTSMAAVTELKLMPSNYFTLSDASKMVIKKGEYTGVVTVRPDSAKFLGDAATINPVYALGMRIASADADTVIVPKNYAVVAFKYESMLYGKYWHGGVTIEKDSTGAVVKETKYYTTIPAPEAKIWILKTVEPFALTINGVSDISSSTKPEMKVTQNGANIVVGSVAGATYQVEPNGASTYNQSKLLQNRKIYLNYKYKKGKNWCYATDTLTFRNRIRDGINEWQDENPGNYN
jgi:hypothetical protein